MKIFDTLINLVSGLGTAKDKSANNTFGLRVLTSAELSAMHRGDWISRKVVDLIPFDMTRNWRDWQASQDQIEKIEEQERRHGVQQKTAAAVQKARLYGGAAIYIGIRGQDPSDELRPETVGSDGLEYLHVLSRSEVTVGEINRDVLSSFFGEPTHYEISSVGASVKIHPSRMVRLIGAPIVEDHRVSTDQWGDSILQAVYDAVQNAASSQQHVAALLPEAKLDIIRIPGLSDTLSTPEGTRRLTERFQYANMMKSMINALVLEASGENGQGGEQWDQKQINFAQFPEILHQFLQVAAGAADIPVTRLLGQSPSGLSSTGESDVRNYYDQVSARQENELRPTLSRLDEVLIRSALGARPPEVHYRWASLWQISDKERADIGKTGADTIKALNETGLFPQEALAIAGANMLVEHAILPGFQEAIEAAGGLPDYDAEMQELEPARLEAGAS